MMTITIQLSNGKIKEMTVKGKNDYDLQCNVRGILQYKKAALIDTRMGK